MKLTIAIGDNELTRRLWERGAIRVEASDLLYAGERERTRIYDRTAAGVDYLGRPFAPYSDKGPFYYYAQKDGYRGERQVLTARFQQRIAAGTLTKSGLGIRFASYADFKRALGRANVDLYGPRAPHMMQALVVKVFGSTLEVGIWGPEAERAQGHNDGIPGRLPQRRFLDVSAGDLGLIGEDIAYAMALRLSRSVPQLLR